ncbi:glutathione S-transferase domain-containing protein [Immersiella caudata]|uniref:Glutathione S-transferase domain-containing protein n=1 Tax=Immersiella caudata TaxID=314043 RepID=A0AA39XF06_9PEZI|nr:glutathione S-transferase domain-containing protein [Immersiella caudata]
MSEVDTSLPTQATGAAASFAALHSNPHPLKLYGAWFCPFVQRVWIVLAEKQIPHQYIDINPYHKSPEFLALNPRGLVPTLALTIPSSDGKDESQKVLYESTVLCEYLDEAYPGENPLLPKGDAPEEVYERARCRLWMDHVGSRIVPAFYRLLQCNGGDEEGMEDARKGLLSALKLLTKEMAPDGGPWFLGQRFGLVDVMMAPWAKRLWLIDHYKEGGVGIPGKGERGEDEEIWGRWERWFEAIDGRRSVRDTWSDEEEYVKAYKRYADDTTQSEVGQATRKGRMLP